MSPKVLLRIASIAEAVTWAVLLIGMLVKYVFDGTGLIVSVGGSLHGAVFIAYLFVGLIVGVNQRFSWLAFILGGFAAIPPFATLLFDWWAEHRGLLEGPWRSATRVTFGEARTALPAEPQLDHGEGADGIAAHATDAVAADAVATETKPKAPIVPALPAHPADARVAERGEHTPPIRWLDPLVRWSVAHPFTLLSVAVLIAALILTGALA